MQLSLQQVDHDRSTSEALWITRRLLKPAFWTAFAILHVAVTRIATDASSESYTAASIYSAVLAVGIFYAFGTPDLRKSSAATLAILGIAAVVYALAAVGTLGPIVGWRLALACLAPIPSDVGLAWLGCRAKERLLLAQERVDRVVVVQSHLTKSSQAVDFDSIHRPCSLVLTLTEEEFEDSIAQLSLRNFMAEHDATILALSSQAIRSLKEPEAVDAFRAGIRIRRLDDFYEQWLGRIRIDQIDFLRLVPDQRSAGASVYLRLIRLLDLATGVLGLLALSILVPVLVVGNRLGNHGPLFFKQTRVGRHGTEFTLWKLRTMRPDSADRSSWTAVKDSRITPFGRFLRLSHFDELPQAINLLNGSLTLIGPRPEQVSYVRLLENEVPHYGCRHFVTPGITGWAQVNYPYGASVDDSEEKLKLDLFYIRQRSLVLDLKIVGRTIRHFLTGRAR